MSAAVRSVAMMCLVAGLALLGSCDSGDEHLHDLESGVFERQLSAADWFTDHPTATALPALVGQLRSQDARVRRACATAILASEDQVSRAAAFEALRRDAMVDDPDVASGAIETLGSAGGEALPELLRITLAVAEPERRAIAVVLVTATVSDADFATRLEATRLLLGAVGSTDGNAYRVAYPVLLALVEPLAPELIAEGLNHPRALVQRAVISAASEQRVAAFSAPIAELLHSPDTGVRKEAVRALGEIGDPAAGSALKNLIERDSQYEVRYEAREALGKMGIDID